MVKTFLSNFGNAIPNISYITLDYRRKTKIQQLHHITDSDEDIPQPQLFFREKFQNSRKNNQVNTEVQKVTKITPVYVPERDFCFMLYQNKIFFSADVENNRINITENNTDEPKTTPK